MESKKLIGLIADDELGDRKNVRRAIVQAGMNCELIEACDIKEIIEASQAHSFDFVLMDYHMPGCNGLESIQYLVEKTNYTAIIMVTGQGDESVAAQAIKLGACDYIAKKHITPETVKQTILSSIEKTILRKKVDEQYEALKNFSYILAHDLSAPLRHIGHFSEMLNMAVEEKNYDKIPNYCERIEFAAERMKMMIDDLNEYNKIRSDDIIQKRLSMRCVTDQAIENLSYDIDKKKAKITVDKLPELTGNASQLIHLMQNLIGNAIKYCDKDVPQVHIGCEVKDGRQCICVKDNGIGIGKAYHERIFEPFERLHSDSDRKYPGTGIGLATCKKVIERHNGNIWCESEEGKGSSFYFSIP